VVYVETKRGIVGSIVYLRQRWKFYRRWRPRGEKKKKELKNEYSRPFGGRNKSLINLKTGKDWRRKLEAHLKPTSPGQNRGVLIPII